MELRSKSNCRSGVAFEFMVSNTTPASSSVGSSMSSSNVNESVTTRCKRCRSTARLPRTGLPHGS